ADDGAFDDARHCIDALLDLLRIDVEPAGDDQVLRAADDLNITLRGPHAHVAGAKVSVGSEFLPGLVRHAPIAGKNVGPLHLDRPDRPRRTGRAVFVDDAQIHPRQWLAHRAADAAAFQRVRRVHPGLGHAIALENAVPG